MKVLHFGRFYDANYGGMERVVGQLLKGLAGVAEVVNLVANDRLRTEVCEVDGYKIVKAPSIGLVAGASLCPTMPLLARSLDRELHFDIAHLHFPDPVSHWAASALSARTKLVISWHSDIVRQSNLLRLYRPFLDRVVARAHAIVAATPLHFSSSTQLSACRDSRRLRVVPYGIDFGPFESPFAAAAGTQLRARLNARRVIFAVGRQVYYKGFDVLIRAMPEIQRDAVLVLGGMGPLHARLRELARDSGVADRIVFPGRIPELELPAYYHAADVFCLPSTQRSEAFGIVQVEAMACRKPVVSCELGNGVSYVNQNGVTGLVVEPRNPQEFAAAINRLLDDDVLRRRMGDAGYSRASREFRVEQMVRGMVEVYRSVLRGRRR